MSDVCQLTSLNLQSLLASLSRTLGSFQPTDSTSSGLLYVLSAAIVVIALSQLLTAMRSRHNETLEGKRASS